MGYTNELDSFGKCAKTGQMAEDLFYKILTQKGKVRAATTSENKAHTDFFLTIGDKTFTYDVKALKKASRNDSNTSDELVWLEFKNVHGNLGWLHAESLDYLAFERKTDFIVVDRKLLLELALKICDLTKIVKSSSQALYSSYTRWQRHDEISLIKMSDIQSIQHEIWAKNI
jgi:hypothetical protein